MDIQKAKQLYRIGKTLKEIGKEFGVSGRTIGRRFKECNYIIRNRSERIGFGNKNPSWKGGKTIKDGYVYVLINEKYVLEHRYIIEKSIGRKLKKYEIVHHINGNRSDNRLENLKLCTVNTHMGHHVLKDIWSRKYDCCIKCKTTKRKHASKGLCTRCKMYITTVENRGYETKHKNGKRIFSIKHRKNLSLAMKGNKNGF